ncbi:MAG: hypothetical protein R6U97_13600, partial [Desulfosalsimonas sp.]
RLQTPVKRVCNVADNKNAGVANPFYRRLESVVEANLDADSTAAFYVACDPNVFDSVEVSFLNGERYPDLETREGWSVDRIEFKVRLEFGCAAIDHRGIYKQPGA